MHSYIFALLASALIFSSLYVWLIHWLAGSWRFSKHARPHNSPEHRKFSVLVVGRNEQSNIRNCLRSIARQEYPHDSFEILFADDHSEDGTLRAVKQLDIPNLTAIDMSEYDLEGFGQAYKKAAQFVAVGKARYDHIACTDADCTVPATWLQSLDAAFSNPGVVFITGLVDAVPADSMLNLFQYIDNRGTMAFTRAGLKKRYYFLANGANMAFEKGVYLEYSKMASYDRASGDDVFFVNWLGRRGQTVDFNGDPEGAVSTRPLNQVSELVQQRLRWSTKTRAYANLRLLIVLGFLFSYVLLLFLCLVGTLFLNAWALVGAVVLFVVKMGSNRYLIRTMEKTWPSHVHVGWRWLPLTLSYFFYFILVGVMGLVRTNYRWKGRKVY